MARAEGYVTCLQFSHYVLQWNMENEDDKASTLELRQGNFELRTSGGITT